MSESAALPSQPLHRSTWWWAALALGLLVRTAGLWWQIPTGDEVHLFRAALSRGFPEVLWHYRMADHCIPLTAYLRAALDLGIEPSEMFLRIPLLASGLATLVAVPLWLKPHLGYRPALVLTWLLCLQPHLIFYSRFIRPYMPAVLLSLIAAAAFLRWWRTGSRRAGLVYAVSAAMTIYFHLVAAPFVLAPFLFVLLETRAGTRPAARRWRDILLLGLFEAALLAAFLVPAWPTLSTLLAAKGHSAAIGLEAWARAAAFISGSGYRIVTLIFWLAVIRGLFVLLGRCAPATRFGLVLVVSQVAAVAIMAPHGANNAAVLSRYLLTAAVPISILLAAGLVDPLPGIGRRRWVSAIAPLVILTLTLTGPFADPAIYGRAFGVSSILLQFQRPEKTGRKVPAPYRWLARQQPGGLVETPVQLAPRFVAPLARYARQHRRRVLVSPRDQALADARYGLRTVVPFGTRELLASGASYVAVHTDVGSELGPQEFGSSFTSENLDVVVAAIDRLGKRQRRSLVAEWGPADSWGDGIFVWDLERVRAQFAP